MQYNFSAYEEEIHLDTLVELSRYSRFNTGTVARTLPVPTHRTYGMNGTRIIQNFFTTARVLEERRETSTRNMIYFTMIAHYGRLPHALVIRS